MVWIRATRIQVRGVARFDRYLLSQLMVIFGFSSVVLVLIYWINRAVRLFDWLIASGQTATVFLEFTALSLPNVIRLVLPISAFAAAVYVTNRLSSESELVVVQATGYSPARLARPVWIFGGIVALFLALLVHFIVPASLGRLADRQKDVAENVTAQLLVEGQFMHPFDGVTLYIGEITPESDLLNVFVRDTRRPGQDLTYTATKALLVRSDAGPQLKMFDGMAQGLIIGSQRLSLTRFSELAFDLETLLRGSIDGTRVNRRKMGELSTLELLSATPALVSETRTSVGMLKVEAHQRITQSLMAMVAPLIGFATLLMGGFSRFGIWNQIVAAILMIVVLKTLDNALADIALSEAAYWPLAYVAPLIGLAMAALILWLAGNPQVYRRKPKAVGK